MEDPGHINLTALLSKIPEFWDGDHNLQGSVGGNDGKKCTSESGLRTCAVWSGFNT